MDEWELYSEKARLLARIMCPKWFGDKYHDRIHHIDHKFSVYAGYMQDISLNIIGNRNNLEPILARDNWKKSVGCSITKEQLFETYITDNCYDVICGRVDRCCNLQELKALQVTVTKFRLMMKRDRLKDIKAVNIAAQRAYYQHCPMWTGETYSIYCFSV
jgi:hypothetical protein